MAQDLVCPRCQESVRKPQLREMEEFADVSCPSCEFIFTLTDFEKQAEREKQRAAWPNHPDRQRLLSEKPRPRSVKSGLTMTWREWLYWKLGYSDTVKRLTLRSAIHKVIYHSVRLAELYPAIPQGLSSPEDVQRFWTDPEDQFVLDAVWRCIEDAGYIAAQSIQERQLSQTDVRSLFEREVPRAQWKGLIEMYTIRKPEIRGLLLAIELGRAQGRKIPKLFVDFLHRPRDQGYNRLWNSQSPEGTS